MTSSSKYRLTLQAAVTVLFLLSSMGFTAMSHACLMGGTVCCDKASNSLDAGRQAVRSNMNDCCRTKLLGGLNTTPALIEKSLESQKQTADHIGAQIQVSGGSSDYAASQSHLLHPLTLRISHASVEKYVLFATLLI